MILRDIFGDVEMWRMVKNVGKHLRNESGKDASNTVDCYLVCGRMVCGPVLRLRPGLRQVLKAFSCKSFVWLRIYDRISISVTVSHTLLPI